MAFWLSFLQHIRDVTDPEHPYTLEQLNVVSEELIQADDYKSVVRSAQALFVQHAAHYDYWTQPNL